MMKEWMRIWVGVAAVLAGCAGQEGIVRRAAAFGPSGDTVKAMTFNIRFGTADDGVNRWQLRRDGVFELIARQGADVVGLQEALAFQTAQIQQAVSGYGVITAAPDAVIKKCEWCSILYRRDRFKVAESGVFWFSNTPWKPGSMHWGNTFARFCVWAQLVEKATGSAFYVYNVHLDHESAVSRQKSAELLAQRVAGREPKDPVVVMGDFNAGMDESSLLYLRRLGYPSAPVELLDTWRRRYPDVPDGRTYHAFEGGTEGYKIDHILTELATEVVDAQIDRTQTASGGYPSDHYPVTATLKLWTAKNNAN